MRAAEKNHRFWSALSLWALLALAMPQLVWACPMTGRVGSTPAQACRCAAPPQSETASSSHRCCQRVPLPPGDASGHDLHGDLQQVNTVASTSPLLVPNGALPVVSMLDGVPIFTASAVLSPSHSPPPPAPHLASSLLGRAPPR